MPLKLLNFAIQNKLVDFHQNCCQTNLHVYIKGWKQTCSTCYWIKKQIEHFPHSPLGIYNSVSQNHLIWEKSNKSSWWHLFFKSETVTSQSISKAKHVSAASFTLYSYVFYRFFFWQQTYTEINQSHPLSPKSSNCCTLHHLDNVQTYQTSKDMYIYNVNCFGFWYICTSALLIMSLYLLNH